MLLHFTVYSSLYGTSNHLRWWCTTQFSTLGGTQLHLERLLFSIQDTLPLKVQHTVWSYCCTIQDAVSSVSPSHARCGTLHGPLSFSPVSSDGLTTPSWDARGLFHLLGPHISLMLGLECLAGQRCLFLAPTFTRGVFRCLRVLPWFSWLGFVSLEKIPLARQWLLNYQDCHASAGLSCWSGWASSRYTFFSYCYRPTSPCYIENSGNILWAL